MKSITYNLAEISVDAVAARLESAFDVQRERAVASSITHYDTVDWRVFAAGGALWTKETSEGTLLRWQEGSNRLATRTEETPGFVADLPSESFRDLLQPVVKMRRLLPMVVVDIESDGFHIVDHRDKTVARATIERGVAKAGDGSRTAAMAPVLVADGVKGYDGALNRLQAVLEGDLGLEPEVGDDRDRAVRAIGRSPGDYSSKLRTELAPTLRADEAMNAINRRLLDIMEQMEPGVVAHIDTEFLHTFRISVRRTRAALTQVKHVYAPDVVDDFREEFAWLGDITGPTRDLDVYQLNMPAYRARLPAEARGDLDPLEAFLANHQRIEQRKLADSLAGGRYRDLKLRWRAFLDTPAPTNTSLTAASLPIMEVSSRRIWKAYRRVIKKGSAIGTETPAERLHELRIEAKKLRYLLEFFRSLYDPNEMKRLIDELKLLQDNLGDFNDLEVQQIKLQEFGNAMLEEGDAPFETYMTMGRLLEVLEAAQEDEREDFHERFDRFASGKNRRRFQTLISPRNPAGA